MHFVAMLHRAVLAAASVVCFYSIAAEAHLNCSSSIASDCHAASFTEDKLRRRTTQSAAITFDEFALGTPITDQYIGRGVLFEGNPPPFTATDNSNPTSPVLSGTPLFDGDITGSFVSPGTTIPMVARSFSFDAGFFNAVGSTRLVAFDPNDQIVQQITNMQTGIERFEITSGNIASFRIEIFGNEAGGYAIDNFVSDVTIGPSIIFRQDTFIAGTGPWPWQFKLNEELPGLNHVGLNFIDAVNDTVVYEAHPGYVAGTYRGVDAATPTATITNQDGVQNQFSRLLFLHNSMMATTEVVRTVEIPIGDMLASLMVNQISTLTLPIQYLPADFTDPITWTNDLQKGGGLPQKFSNVGLIEWAAEQAGHNDAVGFVPDAIESIALPGSCGEAVLLSPELLHFCLTRSESCMVGGFLSGYVEDANFVLTDPLGRQLGYPSGTSLVNEIPQAFITDFGKVVQFLIPFAIGGRYSIETFGSNSCSGWSFVASPDSGSPITSNGSDGTNQVDSFFLPVLTGIRGDIDLDGDYTPSDLLALVPDLDQFAVGFFDRRDLNGDGSIDEDDKFLLELLIDQFASEPPSTMPSSIPSLTPSLAPSSSPSIETFPCVRLAVVMDETWSSGREQDSVSDDLVPGIVEAVTSLIDEVRVLVCTFGFGSTATDPPEAPHQIGCSNDFNSDDFIFDKSGSKEDGFGAVQFAIESFDSAADIGGIDPSLQCEPVRLFVEEDPLTSQAL